MPYAHLMDEAHHDNDCNTWPLRPTVKGQCITLNLRAIYQPYKSMALKLFSYYCECEFAPWFNRQHAMIPFAKVKVIHVDDLLTKSYSRLPNNASDTHTWTMWSMKTSKETKMGIVMRFERWPRASQWDACSWLHVDQMSDVRLWGMSVHLMDGSSLPQGHTGHQGPCPYEWMKRKDIFAFTIMIIIMGHTPRPFFLFISCFYLF